MVRIVAVVAGVALLGGVWASRDQAPSPLLYLSGKSEADIVAFAEREALAFPVDSGVPTRLKKVFAFPIPSGTAERKCVEASGLGPVRSGEFVIGGSLSGPDLIGRGMGVAPKIWWSPLHHSATMNLVVRARRGGSAEEYRFHGMTVAWGAGAGQPVPEGEREYFFPSGVEFLHSGRWVAVATQGSDWGCFILNLPQPRLSVG